MQGFSLSCEKSFFVKIKKTKRLEAALNDAPMAG